MLIVFASMFLFFYLSLCFIANAVVFGVWLVFYVVFVFWLVFYVVFVCFGLQICSIFLCCCLDVHSFFVVQVL